MIDRERLFKAIEFCRENARCDGCPYEGDCVTRDNPIEDDTLELLQEQEPLVVHDPGAICPNCKWPLYPEDHPHYCGNCGREVKWDA